MRQAAGLVFDEFVAAGAGHFWYTSTELNEFLGTADHMALQVIVAEAVVSPGATMTVGVWIETSADGVNWALKNTALEVSPFTVSATGTTVSGHCYDSNALPSMKFVRLRVFPGVTPSGTATAHVRVYVTLRDSGGRRPKPARSKFQPATPEIGRDKGQVYKAALDAAAKDPPSG